MDLARKVDDFLHSGLDPDLSPDGGAHRTLFTCDVVAFGSVFRPSGTLLNPSISLILRQ